MATSSKEMEELRATMLKYREEALRGRIDAQFGVEGGGRPPPIPDSLILDMDNDLVLGDYTSSYSICANSIDRKGLWASDDPQFLDTLVNPDAYFGNRLAQLCSQAKVQKCTRSICVQQRKRMDRIAPECQWRAFRDWAVTAMACQALFTPPERRRRAFTHLVSMATLCHWLLARYRQLSKPLDNILAGRRKEY